jgi:hypothetical protein
LQPRRRYMRQPRGKAAICAGHRRCRAGCSACNGLSYSGAGRGRGVASSAGRAWCASPARSSAEAHGMVSDSGRIADVTTRTPKHTTGSRDRQRSHAALLRMFSDYRGLPAFQSGQAQIRPSQAQMDDLVQHPRNTEIQHRCGLPGDGETRTRTRDTTIFSRVAFALCLANLQGFSSLTSGLTVSVGLFAAPELSTSYGSCGRADRTRRDSAAPQTRRRTAPRRRQAQGTQRV